MTAVVRRPVTLKELASFHDNVKDIANDFRSLQKIIGLCRFLFSSSKTNGLFRSAKDFLLTRVPDKNFPSCEAELHYTIVSKSFEVTSCTLHRDMYNLCAPGIIIGRGQQPEPDLLAAVRYSCVHSLGRTF